MARFANLNQFPLVLPGPKGTSVMLRPGEVISGPWWTRHVGPRQLSRVSGKYTPPHRQKQPRAPASPVRAPAPGLAPRKKSAGTAIALGQYTASYLAKLTPAQAWKELQWLHAQVFPVKRWPNLSRKQRKQMWPAFMMLSRAAIPSPSWAGLKNKHAGKRCFVIGNGPSLDKLNLGLLRNEITFGCNMIFQHPQVIFPLTYFVCSDQRLAVGCKHMIDPWFKARKTTKRFFQWPQKCHQPTLQYAKVLQEAVRDGRTYITLPRAGHLFSTNVASWCSMGGGTAGFLLQLAYYMGCNPVYTIGIDCTVGEFKAVRYPPPIEKVFARLRKTPTWKRAAGHEHSSVQQRLALANQVFRHAKRTVLNATPGGKLKVFPRVTYAKLFKGRSKK